MKLGWLMIAIALSGCASLASSPLQEAQGIEEGLVYYLPRRDVEIVVTVEDNRGITGVEIKRGPPYADLDHPHALTFEQSWIGESKVDIGISVDGLLSKSDASTTPKLIDALGNAVSQFAANSVGSASVGTCVSPGKHTFVVPVCTSKGRARADAAAPWCDSAWICGGLMTATVRELLPTEQLGTTPLGQVPSSKAGVFYRQSRPYLVEVVPVAGVGLHTQAVVLLPTRSPTRFLPLQRTLFAKSEAKLGFDGGEPTSFVQIANGEIPALVELPAAVLKMYFAAVGAILSGFAATDEDRAKALAAEAKLVMVERQMAACKAAAAASPANEELIQQLCAVAP